MIDDDLDALLLRILELPLGGLEEAARLARHDLDIPGAEPQRSAAAVHRRIADADDQHALADGTDVAEGDRFQPGDADMDAIALVAARQLELLALRRARADEHRVVSAGAEQIAAGSDRRVELQPRAHVEDHADLLIQHLCGSRKEGILVRIRPPAAAYCSKMLTS